MPARIWIRPAVAAAAALVTAAPLLAAASPSAAAPATGPRPSAVTTATYRSLVYVKHGDIYLAHPDGSHTRVVKQGTFSWPSMDDKGVIAAERADGRTAPDGSTGYSIYRFTQTGTRLSRVSTPADYSTFSCPTYRPSHVTLSPDGTKVAYDVFFCDEFTALWTPTTKMSFPHQGAGQEDYQAPTWLSNSRIMLSHVGVRVAGGKEIGIYATSDGQDSVRDWFDADSWATGFVATATRDGTKVAVLEDDAANYFDGTPRHVKLVLGTAAGRRQPVTVRCRVSLPAAGFPYGTSQSRLSFRPNGAALVWDAKAGLWHAITSHLGDCGTLHAHLWIDGAHSGFYSPAVDHR